MLTKVAGAGVLASGPPRGHFAADVGEVDAGVVGLGGSWIIVD
jgi:hypothetical protein